MDHIPKQAMPQYPSVGKTLAGVFCVWKTGLNVLNSPYVREVVLLGSDISLQLLKIKWRH